MLSQPSAHDMYQFLRSGHCPPPPQIWRRHKYFAAFLNYMLLYFITLIQFQYYSISIFPDDDILQSFYVELYRNKVMFCSIVNVLLLLYVVVVVCLLLPFPLLSLYYMFSVQLLSQHILVHQCYPCTPCSLSSFCSCT